MVYIYMCAYVYLVNCDVTNLPSQAPDVLAITAFLVTEEHENVEPLFKLLLKQVRAVTRTVCKCDAMCVVGV